MSSKIHVSVLKCYYISTCSNTTFKLHAEHVYLHLHWLQSRILTQLALRLRPETPLPHTLSCPSNNIQSIQHKYSIYPILK